MNGRIKKSLVLPPPTIANPLIPSATSKNCQPVDTKHHFQKLPTRWYQASSPKIANPLIPSTISKNRQPVDSKHHFLDFKIKTCLLALKTLWDMKFVINLPIRYVTSVTSNSWNERNLFFFNTMTKTFWVLNIRPLLGLLTFFGLSKLL